MSQLSAYESQYPNVKLTRQDGILEMQLHTEGGSLVWAALKGSIHEQLGDAFYNIGADPENKVVIITGTGDVFCDSFDMDATIPASGPSPYYWERIYREGKDMLLNLLNIPVPVIGAVNGPAHVHAELAVLSDIVLASETATFADRAHFWVDAVPGDGVQVVWPLLLGVNRGRAFLLTGQEIDAREALGIGFVAEVLPEPQLLPRAWEIARVLAQKPRSVLHYTRVALTRPLREKVERDLGYGLMAEGMAVLARDWPGDQSSE